MTVKRCLRVLRKALPVAAVLPLVLCASGLAASKTQKTTSKCDTDAMIVFDASGSMTGMGFGETSVRRIEQVRRALATVLPEVAPMRKIGLVVFGPGRRRQCENIDLRLPPSANAAKRIMSEVDALQPYGQTPLTSAVGAAAEALDFRDKPAVIVLLTDGDETCQGDPCALANRLKAEGHDVTVHVIGYMLEQGTLPTGGQFARCLSEGTGGMFVSTNNTEELIAALQKTLSCPFLSHRPAGRVTAARN
jgi:Ca-activated chloride channel family protein